MRASATAAGNRAAAQAEAARLLSLAYPGHPDIDLWIKLNGCGGVSNGYITAEGV